MKNLSERLEEIYGQKSWIIATQAAVSAVNLHKMLGEWGSRTLVVASNEGTGDLPDTEIVYTGSKGDSAVGSIREFFDSVVYPSPQVQARVENFDPENRARVIAEPYATAAEMVGRTTFGVRHPEWGAWEDKMRVDALWEDLSVPHADYRIVDVADAPTAASEIGNEMGSVWVADNSQGWHGGGDFVKWIRHPDQSAEVADWFADRADRVRVMPFLDGLPCSIHGWVTDTGVATFLPVEILVLRDTADHTMVYSGVSTSWVAPSGLSDEMRAVALKVGRELSQRDGYLGLFGIDGISTVDGFRPTELNPRMSVGAGAQMGGVDLPIWALTRAEIEGLVHLDHEWIESEVLGQRKPTIHFGKMVHVDVRESVFIGLGRTGKVNLVDTEQESVAKITAGPSATGSFVTGSFDTEKIGTGPPVAPMIADTLNLVSGEWDLGFPYLTAAPNLVG